MRKILVCICALLFGTMSSCDKWLTLSPEDGLTDEEYWKSKEQLEASVMGCYASLLGGSSMPLAKYLFLWGELRGGMVTGAIDPSSDEELSALSNIKRDEINIMRTDIASTNVITNWEAVYKTINNCNVVIANAQTVLDNDRTITQAQLNGFLGEARGLRGLMYFYLLRTFGEVPIKLNPTSKDADITPIAKSAVQEVYTQIVEDVTYAAENCVVQYPSIVEEKGRISKFTAHAILADVYLWGEDYQKCIDACDVLISSGKYQLFPAGSDPADWYTRVFYNGNSVESVFELQFYEGKLNPFFDMFASGSKEMQAAEWIVTGGLFGQDVVNNTQDIRGSGTSILEANGSINKFTGNRTNANSYSHWFIYRYSDVLMMKAEALTWLRPGDTENGQLALNIIKDIRLRRGALTVVGNDIVDDPQLNDPQKLSDYIINERSREFAFEGKRWFDLLRSAKRNNYQNEEMLMDVVAEAAPPSKQQIVINKYRDKRSHYLPIYYYEIQTNTSLVQNPFYQ